MGIHRPRISIIRTGKHVLNTYTVQFFAFCPTNEVRILYTLSIEIDTIILVENLIEVVTMHDRGYHEDIADQLLREFGGRQTMTANHHGVDIKTVRMIPLAK